MRVAGIQTLVMKKKDGRSRSPLDAFDELYGNLICGATAFSNHSKQESRFHL